MSYLIYYTEVNKYNHDIVFLILFLLSFYQSIISHIYLMSFSFIARKTKRKDLYDHLSHCRTLIKVVK